MRSRTVAALPRPNWRQELHLDPGYLSRVLKRLTADSLLVQRANRQRRQAAPSPIDAPPDDSASRN